MGVTLDSLVIDRPCPTRTRVLLYCPGRGSNTRPPAHRSFKHGQGTPRPLPLGHGQCHWVRNHLLPRVTDAEIAVTVTGCSALLLVNCLPQFFCCNQPSSGYQKRNPHSQVGRQKHLHTRFWLKKVIIRQLVASRCFISDLSNSWPTHYLGD